MNLMFRLLFLFWLSVHPVHVSLTSIEYIKESRQFNGFVRIYLDDFLADCRLHGLEINEGDLVAGRAEANEKLGRYINIMLSVIVNDKSIRGDLRSVRIAENEVNVDLTFKNVNEPSVIRVRNIIMTDLYKDQANMTIVKVGEYEKGVKFTPELTEQTFKIN